MATYKFKPTLTLGTTKTSSSDSQPKSRIYNVFKPTIVLDEISVRQTKENSKKFRVEDFASLEYPLIKINDYIIGQSEINSLIIKSEDFLPTIILQTSFKNELFLSKNMPKDGDIISIFIRNKSDLLVPVRNDYVITGVSTLGKGGPTGGIINMTFFGELFVPGLKSYLGSAAKIGTSMETLQDTAQSLELGFNTNENDTDDKQVWYIAGDPLEFIEDVTLKAWKDENSFFDSWIDIYYNLNFVNVQKQLLSNEDEVDIGVLLSNVDTGWTWGSNTEENKSVKTPKVFSNYPGFRNTSFYILGWKPDNRSTAITFNFGTSMEASFFEHLDSLYSEPESKQYWKIKIDPDYDPQKVNSHILLRGRAHWDASTNVNELAQANYSYKDLYKQAPWLGIQYTVDNPDAPHTEWTGNHHSNYLRAQAHNTINKAEIEKLQVHIMVQGTNMNIIKGDKLPIALIKMEPTEVKMAYPESDHNEALDFFYSGWYYVKGFNITFSKGVGELLSSFRHNFILTRREWPTPVPVEPINDVKPKNNENI